MRRKFIMSLMMVMTIMISTPVTVHAAGCKKCGGGGLFGLHLLPFSCQSNQAINAVENLPQNIANSVEDAAGNIIDKATESLTNMFSAVNGPAESLAGSFSSVSESFARITATLPEFAKSAGIVLAILLLFLLLMLLMAGFGIKGLSQSRNNPAALERLRLLHAHKEKMAQVATMTQFN